MRQFIIWNTHFFTCFVRAAFDVNFASLRNSRHSMRVQVMLKQRTTCFMHACASHMRMRMLRRLPTTARFDAVAEPRELHSQSGSAR
eukprot:8393500-Lingulodinium_polyedra.AAC.1